MRKSKPQVNLVGPKRPASQCPVRPMASPALLEWYIPHHGLYHLQKPWKICVVFDPGKDQSKETHDAHRQLNTGWHGKAHLQAGSPGQTHSEYTLLEAD